MTPRFRSQKDGVLIVSIGDELVHTNKVNTTAPKIAASLSKLGWERIRLFSIMDGPEEIEYLFNTIIDSKEYRVVIFTGGLGATGDDDTVASIAKALNRPLLIDEEQKQKILQLLSDRNISEPDIVDRMLKQATYPEGFEIAINPYGTAGFIHQLPSVDDDSDPFCKLHIFLLPGVPSECIALFQEKVIPIITPLLSGNLSTQTADKVTIELKIIDISETKAEHHLSKIIDDFQRQHPGLTVKISYLPSGGELLLRLTAEQKWKETLLQIQQKLTNQLKEHLYYFSSDPLSHFLHQKFIEKGLKFGTVESCTGGLLCAEFVQYSGSSQYLDSSLITYSGQAKESLAKVSNEILENYGQVSRQTAVALATYHALNRKLNLCVSVTGIAGPKGGSEEKPVGLVYLGVYFQHENLSKPIKTCRRLNLPSHHDRNDLRQRTLKRALILISQILRKAGLV